MKKLIGLVLLTVAFVNASDESNGYSVQLATYEKEYKDYAKEYVNKLPKSIQEQTVIYPQGKYLAIRYSSATSLDELSKKLEYIKSSISKDAYIVKVSIDMYKKMLNESKKLTDSDKNELTKTIREQRLHSQKKLQETFSNNNTYSYSIQLYSFHKLDDKGIVKAYNELPQEMKSNIALYPSGEYITFKYLNKREKNDFQKDGIFKKIKYIFDDAYISTVVTDRYKEYLHQTKKRFIQDKEIENEDLHGYTKACIQKQSFKLENLSTHEYTKILVDAHELKSTNQVIESIKMYEKGFAHAQNNSVINNNLFYLYGKTNNWPKAVEKVCLVEKTISKVLYSYALGALEINNPMLENELSDYLKDDQLGYLHLALGVFFERNENFEKAHRYYKKSYDLNRYDMYLAYAYARSSEIQSDYKNALFMYGIIARNNDTKYINLQKQSIQRYEQLQRYLSDKG